MSFPPPPAVVDQPPADDPDPRAMRRRIASAVGLSVALTAALAVAVFIVGSVVGAVAWSLDGLWVVTWFLVTVMVAAPMLYVVSVLLFTARLFPRGRRVRPRVVAFAAATPVLALVLGSGLSALFG